MAGPKKVTGNKTGPQTGQILDQKKWRQTNKKFDKINNEKDLKKYVGGKINLGIDKGASKVKEGANKAIGYVGGKLVKGGVDKNLVDYGARRIGRGIGDLVRQGSGAAKKWIHTEGKQALQKGAQEVGNKIKQGWESVKSKFRR